MTWIQQAHDVAARTLPRPVMEYFSQGATAQVSRDEALTAWDGLRLRPRVLRDVSTVSTAATVLGRAVDTPVLVAPTTLQRNAHPDGEIAMAKATTAAGSLLCVSSNAGTSFADIGDIADDWWMQAYVLRDRDVSAQLVRRAASAGATAIVLTVDTPVVGTKYSGKPEVWESIGSRDLMANIDTANVVDSAFEKADDLTATDIGWLRDTSGLPVVVKGVLRGDDAAACAAAGASAIWVSNHGGRQLDLAMSTTAALPEIVTAVEGTGAEIYVDGGVRRGEHVLAALALGADAVFLGRPMLWGLAADGAAGAARVIDDVTDQLRHAMTLAGAANLGELTSDLVC